MSSELSERYRAGSLLAERYEVVRLLGIGAVGEVYHVRDTALDYRSMAVKALHSHLARNEAILQRFQNEVIITRQLAHENIVRTYDFISYKNSYFLSMEYVNGCDLRQILSSTPKLPVSDIIYILVQLSEALNYAHSKSVIHRDLKPENILIDTSGLLKLSDFSIARSIEHSHGLTRTGEVIGSPAYLAPEQFRNPTASTSADIYSLGIIGYELLTGKLPYNGESLLALALEHSKQTFPTQNLTKRGAPPWLSDLLTQCCEKDSQKRVPTARAFLDKISEQTNNSASGQNIFLKTIVKKQSKDAAILNKSQKVWVTAIWVGINIFVAAFCAFDHSSHSRVLKTLTAIEIESGQKLPWLQKLILGQYYDPLDPQTLIDASRLARNDSLLALTKGGADPLARFTDGTKDTAIHRAIKLNTSYLLSLINRVTKPNQKNADGDTPLLLATKLGAGYAVAALLKVGARFDIPDSEGNYPLHIATARGHTHLISEIFDKSDINLDLFSYVPLDDFLSIHRSSRTSLNRSIKTKQGLAALHLAVIGEHSEIVEIFIRNQFDLEIRDNDGRTPLMLSLKDRENTSNKRVFDLLVNAGAQLNARDNKGRSVLDYARISKSSYWHEKLKLVQSGD